MAKRVAHSKKSHGKTKFHNQSQRKLKSQNKSGRNFVRKPKKQEIKKKKIEKNLKQQEKDINDIETENLLFEGNTAYYAPPKEEDQYEEEWNTFNQEGSISILNMMNQVKEHNLDPKVIEAFTLVGDILSKYTSGKLPKAFNILPVTNNWEELLEITQPINWSPPAMYEATKLFSSNLNAVLAERFYEIALLPAIRKNINENRKLNIHYYNCLKKALFKPAAFFKGIIVPLSEKANLKESTIIGSIIKKCSIPVQHSSAGIMKLIEDKSLRFNMSRLFFLKLILSKKYALPTMVKEELVNYFYNFIQRKEALPVLWHQSLLVFVQTYKNDLTDPEKESLKKLIQIQRHHIISDEILKELNFVPKNNPLNMFIDS